VNEKKRIANILSNIPKENFKIEHILDDGYFNGVAIVRNNKLAGRLENIKFLESVEPYLRERFLKEGKFLSALQHKNIPRVYDILEHEEVLLFRSEYIEGHSLREVLDFLNVRKEEFPRRTAASIILKLMNALYYTHNEVRFERKRKGIIHCDIKPSNIIISVKGHKINGKLDDFFLQALINNNVEPYLIDFGIAKFIGEEKNGEGTLHYLSPAQVSNNNSDSLDWRSDMHQLLLVYYEMLTNKKPYARLSKKNIMHSKLSEDFSVKNKDQISHFSKKLIEKGTKRNSSNSFKAEKECIKAMIRIDSIQEVFQKSKKYKKPLIGLGLTLLVISFCIWSYILWDQNVKSTDAILELLEKKEKIGEVSTDQLDDALNKIQIRSFEKKYYKPLMNGDFRDVRTMTPLYPSHLSADGKWILTGPDVESAGSFVGLLFEYSDKYPELEEYAIEYAEPILNSKYDGTSGKRFVYALIPAYEKTKDERYLAKLEEVANSIINDINNQKGMTQCDDLYYADLFIFLYIETGDKRYIYTYDKYVLEFTRNNIDFDGYVYAFASVNASSDGISIPDIKASIIVKNITGEPIGNYLEESDENKRYFKNETSILTRDYIEVMSTMNSMYIITKNFEFKDASDNMQNNYYKNSQHSSTDYLYFANYDVQEVPYDSLSTVKAISFLNKKNQSLYYEKLEYFLIKDNFRRENEYGILSGGVLLENTNYANFDELKKNQSLIETDAIFLTIGIE